MVSAFDIVIIGGGPAGSTTGVLLKKYRPDLRVAIFEKAIFPRDHVGESQLPYISQVLNEMGVWDEVEAAGFPIKIGATYRWGVSDQLWDFEFINRGIFHPNPRPSKYEGQRRLTAFQVDRSVYDKLLLDHAARGGCEVQEGAAVVGVKKQGDAVTSLEIKDDHGLSTVTAKHYVDASGYAAVLRKAFKVEAEYPTSLQNIAIWDYWRGAEWAVRVGTEGTRVQVLSLGYGWIWYIPISTDRTSVGLIVSAKYYKARGRRPSELYDEALNSDKIVSSLLEGATCESQLQSTKDWSFLAARLAGENWFLAGESAGFADPILSAGMSLAHQGGRDAAYTILELERGELDSKWLRDRYSGGNRRHIMQHIRFADFWYTHNGQFSDLKGFAQVIATDAGLNIDADDAWRWLGTGGFIDGDSAGTNLAGFPLVVTKNLSAAFLGEGVDYKICGKTHFKLDLEGAEETWGATCREGRIFRHARYVRNGKSLPMVGVCGFLSQGLKQERTAQEILEVAENYRVKSGMSREDAMNFPIALVEGLEAMVLDGWVSARAEPGHRGWPRLEIDPTLFMHENRDVSKRLNG